MKDNYDPNGLVFNKIPIYEKAPKNVNIYPHQQDESIKVEIDFDDTYLGAILKLKEHATRLVNSLYRDYYYDINFFQWSIYDKAYIDDHNNIQHKKVLSYEFTVEVKEDYTNNGYSKLSKTERELQHEKEIVYNPVSEEIIAYYDSI